MVLDTGTDLTSETGEEEKVKLEGQESNDSPEEELMDLLAEDDFSSDMDEDDLMKGIDDIVSGADKKREKIDINTEIGEEKPTDSMTMAEIFGVVKLTEENFKKVSKLSKVTPVMSMFDTEKGTLDITNTIEIVYGGQYVKDIVKRMRKSKKKKILERKEGVKADLEGIAAEEDDILATKRLVGELDSVLAKTGGQESIFDKLAGKAEGVPGISFLMKKSGYLDSALQNKVDTLGDALDMLDNLDSSYKHRTLTLKTSLENNFTDYKTLKNQRKKVMRLQEIVNKVFDLRKGAYERMDASFEAIYVDLSESKKAESLTYKKEFYDEVLQLIKLVKSVDEYVETLEVLEISTRTHMKILKSLYQTLLTSYPQVEAILTALLQQMDNASVEHQVIDTEETIRGSISTGMTLMRKSTAKAAKRAEKISTGRVFEKSTLKKENLELRKIETSFDTVRAGLLKERETMSAAIEQVEEIVEQTKEENRLEAVNLTD